MHCECMTVEDLAATDARFFSIKFELFLERDVKQHCWTMIGRYFEKTMASQTFIDLNKLKLL